VTDSERLSPKFGGTIQVVYNRDESAIEQCRSMRMPDYEQK
jgi:hypothetical protein